MAEESKPRESFGAIRTMSGGRYQAGYLAKTTPDAKPKRFYAPGTFDTLQDARAWLKSQKIRLEENTWVSPDEAAQKAETFNDCAQRWIDNRRVKGKPLRPRTREEYLRLLAGPLGSLAETPMVKITRDQIDKWHRDQSATGKLTQTARG